MSKLEDLIPDPSTREFLRAVKREWGREWAVTLTRGLHQGWLIDMGPVEPEPEQPEVQESETIQERLL